jgi:hypothetical protein
MYLHFYNKLVNNSCEVWIRQEFFFRSIYLKNFEPLNFVIYSMVC